MTSQLGKMAYEEDVATILKMPVGISSWNAIRREHMFFVDKTGYLSELMRAGRRIFIARPRRMGKTTMCSLLDEALSHGLDSFRGLNIEKTGSPQSLVDVAPTLSHGWSRQTPSQGTTA